MALPLALTMGEPAGIGGEIALKAWLDFRDDLPPFYLIDDPDRLAALARRLEWQVPIRPIGASDRAASIFADALPVLPIGMTIRAQPGRPNPADAPAILGAIQTAVRELVRLRS
jgi:4-hydroxythreonine-4-phosphate dehydrogenase